MMGFRFFMTMVLALASAGSNAVTAGAPSPTRPATDAPLAKTRVSPFSKVNRDHWAYDAIHRAAADGLWPPGKAGPLNPDRATRRFEVAYVLGAMLDRARTRRADGRTVTAQDLANLERLSLEFADEMAIVSPRLDRVQSELDGLARDVRELRRDIHHRRGRTRFDAPYVNWPPGR